MTSIKSIFAALLLILFSLVNAACATSSKTGLPPNGQLAISPDGSRLLVTWHDNEKKLHAKIANLTDGSIISWTDTDLHPLTFTTAFSLDGESLLITTISPSGENSLIRTEINKNTTKILYRSNQTLRFSIEITPEDYVFLEGIDSESRYSRWQRYRNGTKAVLNSRIYNSATTLSLSNGNLYILEPWTPPAFRPLIGKIPKQASDLITTKTFNVECSNTNVLSCLVSELVLRGNRYFSKQKIFTNGVECTVDGEWLDVRGEVISGNGKVVAFHATVSDKTNERAIVVINNDRNTCNLSTSYAEAR